ncbi:MAG: hypothetical protein QXR71_04605 [Candidatus Aenigmatarchaeota archaeon]
MKILQDLVEVLIAVVIVLGSIGLSLQDKQISKEEETQIKGYILNLMKIIAEKLKMKGIGIEILCSSFVIDIFYGLIVTLFLKIIEKYYNQKINQK